MNWRALWVFLATSLFSLSDAAFAEPAGLSATDARAVSSIEKTTPSTTLSARAIVVIGLTTDKAQALRLRAQAALAQEGFLARGFRSDAIQLVAGEPGARLTREKVLSVLRPSPTAAPTEETWLILLGDAAPDREGHPAFQVSGPRLSANDFAKAVSALSGKKFIVVATPMSGGFLPVLQPLSDVEAVAATADSGEIYEPYFGQAWTEALVATPRAEFAALAAEAARRVETYYRENSLAQGEHARLIDQDSRTIIEVAADQKKSADQPAHASR